MSNQRRNTQELIDEEFIDLENENELDDAKFLNRIRNIVMGDVHPDFEGETVEEQALFTLKTIVRQLRSRTLSLAAQGYLAHCLERFIDGEALSLDKAFYLRYDKKPGGQSVASNVERDVIKAYRSVIRQHQNGIDANTSLPIYMPISKTIHRQAKQAALQAYWKATGKEKDELEPEKRILQTITPMLKRWGVLMPEDKSKSK